MNETKHVSIIRIRICASNRSRWCGPTTYRLEAIRYESNKKSQRLIDSKQYATNRIKKPCECGELGSTAVVQAHRTKHWNNDIKKNMCSSHDMLIFSKFLVFRFLQSILQLKVRILLMIIIYRFT